MTDGLNQYRAELIALREACKAIIVSNQPDAQKLLAKVLNTQLIVVREIARVDRLYKVKPNAPTKPTK